MLRKIILIISALASFIIILAGWANWPHLLNRMVDAPVLLTSAEAADQRQNAATLNMSSLRGQYGDSFGPLNTLFTGLAFLAVVITILLQIEDGVKRDFENNFFRLLDMWREQVNGVERTTIGPTGGQIIQKGSTAIQGHAMEMQVSLEGNPPADLAAYLLAYDNYFKNHPVFDAYFRTLYYVFRYIDRAKGIKRQEYADITRAMLTKAELEFLIANCLIRGRGYEKFKPLVEKYHVFKHAAEKEGALYEARNLSYKASVWND